MRTIVQFVFIIMFLTGFITLHAQPGGRGGDPVQRADYQTKIMADSLSLSDAQSTKVGEINLKYAKKMQEARENNPDGDWEAMRATMQTMRTEQDKELQAVMTQEQWQRWSQIRETMRAQRGGPGGGQPGDKPAPPRGKEKSKEKSKGKAKNKTKSEGN